MKIRMRGNSLRLRLLRGEVGALARGGRVTETIAFGGGPGERLVCVLAADPAVPQTQARFTDGTIEVLVPVALALQWSQSEAVGIEHEQAIDAGRSLHILIEKDFACLAPRTGEEDDGTFANPKALPANARDVTG